MTNSTKTTFFLAILLFVTLVSGQKVPFPSSFVETRGTQFVLNGSPFLFNGFNSYWLMNVASRPNERYKITNVFRDAAAAGLTVCRTWAISDGGDQALQISPGVHNELFFQGLDFVISEARNYRIQLILSLSNNYHDFGGRPQYVNWGRAAGVSINSDDDFYTNEVVKRYFKNHVTDNPLLEDYNVEQRVNDFIEAALTQIFANAFPVHYSPPTGFHFEVFDDFEPLQGWVQEMASHVKSIDNKHLLETGLEGFYGDSIEDRKQFNPGFQVGSDFITNNQIKEIDFTTIHAYPDQWLPGQRDNVHIEFMQRWMTSHWTDSRTILKKPLVFAEFGKSSKDSGFSISVRDSFLNTIYTNIYDLAKNGGTIDGSMVWQVMAEQMESYYDGYEVVLSQNPSTTNVITQHLNNITAVAHSLNRNLII